MLPGLACLAVSRETGGRWLDFKSTHRGRSLLGKGAQAREEA